MASLTSVTRCWSKNEPNCLQKLPKKYMHQFNIKSTILPQSPKMLLNVWATLSRNFVPNNNCVTRGYLKSLLDYLFTAPRHKKCTSSWWWVKGLHQCRILLVLLLCIHPFVLYSIIIIIILAKFTFCNVIDIFAFLQCYWKQYFQSRNRFNSV